MPRIRFTAATLLASAAGLGFAGSAHADTTLYARGLALPAPNGDCLVHAALERTAGGALYARGNTNCGARKVSTVTTTYLKFNLNVIDQASTTFTNSIGMGDHWVNTRAFSGCGGWQAVTATTVTDGLGRQTSQSVTSNTPVFTC